MPAQATRRWARAKDCRFHGLTLTATITRESGETPQLGPEDPAQALIKASLVILAVD